MRRLTLLALLGLFGLLACSASARAQACDCPDDPSELQVVEQVVVTLKRPLTEQPSFATFEENIAFLVANYDIEELSPPQRIPELLAFLARTSRPDIDVLLDEIRREDTGTVLVRHANEHWEFETPEGGQRNLPDLTRTLALDDYLMQPAALIIRADPAAAWTGAGVTVAVIDTAAATTHPATAAVMVGSGFDALEGEASADLPSNGSDDDADGLIDESEHHGTFAAGLVHLAAPGARLLHVRALDDDGHGESFAVARAIVRAVQEGARVLNLSLGLSREQRIIDEAVDWAVAEHGVVVIASTGNGGLACLERPAANLPDGVIAVAAVDDALVRADFGNHASCVALSAPGVQVLSTHGAADYGAWSGTSFAAPLVAGGAAILLEKHPGLWPEEVRWALQVTAQPDANVPPFDALMGAGVLDLQGLRDYEPPDRQSLRLSRAGAGVEAAWAPVGGALAYDLVRGELANLGFTGAEVTLGPLSCLAEDLPAAPGAFLLDADPVPAGGFFYLVRDDAPDPGGRSYGRGRNDSGRWPRVPGVVDCAP